MNMEEKLSSEKVIVIDFGGQYNQLVARRVRECNVYCEIYSYKTDIEQIKAMNPKGIILTGGLIAAMRTIRRHIKKSCLSWGFRCWGFAMVRSL